MNTSRTTLQNDVTKTVQVFCCPVLGYDSWHMMTSNERILREFNPLCSWYRTERKEYPTIRETSKFHVLGLFLCWNYFLLRNVIALLAIGSVKGQRVSFIASFHCRFRTIHALDYFHRQRSGPMSGAHSLTSDFFCDKKCVLWFRNRYSISEDFDGNIWWH